MMGGQADGRGSEDLTAVSPDVRAGRRGSTTSGSRPRATGCSTSAARSRHPAGGFAWLDDDGRPQLDRPVELWITCRMTHVFALGHLLGRPGCGAARRPRRRRSAGPLARRRARRLVRRGRRGRADDDGQAGLRARLRRARRRERHRRRAARWPRAARRGARGLLERFWDDEHGLVVEQWDESFRPWTATAASTPTCTRSRRCWRPPTSLGDARCASAPCASSSASCTASRRGHDWRHPRALRRALDAAAGLQRRRAGAPVPAVRRDHRALARVGAARAAPARRARATPRPGGCSTTRASLFDAAVARAGPSTGPTGSSTRSTGTGRPSCASGCTGWRPRASPRRRPCTRRPATRRTPSWYAQWWDYIRATASRPEHGSWRHELSPATCPAPRDLVRASPTSTTRSRPRFSRGCRSPPPWPRRCVVDCSTDPSGPRS